MSEDETAFMRSIRKKPEDLAIRLIFADWLEEHDDSRGELIRIEEEMKNLTVFSDRYWELKHPRKRLRETADKKWLKKMGYSASIPYLFSEVPDDYKSRWRILRELAERWWGVPMPDIGGPLTPVPEKSKLEPREWKSVDDALNNPATVIPASMREWMYFVRDLQVGLEYFDGGFGNGHHFSDSEDEIHFLQLEGNRELVFVEGENRSEPDPTIRRSGIIERTRDESVLIGARISFLALHLILVQWCNEDHWDAYGDYKLDEDILNQCTKFFSLQTRLDDIHIFEKEDAIAIWAPSSLFFSRDFLQIRATSRKGLAELEDFFFSHD